MSALTEPLDRIQNWLQKYYPTAVSSLEVGLSYEELEKTVTNLPFCLPREVYELYQWRNGNRYYHYPFFYYHYFLPLKEAAETCQQIIEADLDIQEPDFKIQYKGNPLFPIFEFEGEYWAVVLDKDEKETSPVVFISEIGEVCEISYTSVTNMMLTIAECYEEGAYYLDKDEYLNTNSKQEESIRQKYNPGSKKPWE